MTRVKIDDTLRKKLNDLAGPLELCDDAGKTVAWVTPVPPANGSFSKEPPALSEEELTRREGEPDFSTAELLAHLEKQ